MARIMNKGWWPLAACSLLVPALAACAPAKTDAERVDATDLLETEAYLVVRDALASKGCSVGEEWELTVDGPDLQLWTAPFTCSDTAGIMALVAAGDESEPVLATAVTHDVAPSTASAVNGVVVFEAFEPWVDRVNSILGDGTTARLLTPSGGAIPSGDEGIDSYVNLTCRSCVSEIVTKEAWTRVVCDRADINPADVASGLLCMGRSTGVPRGTDAYDAYQWCNSGGLSCLWCQTGGVNGGSRIQCPYPLAGSNGTCPAGATSHFFTDFDPEHENLEICCPSEIDTTQCRRNMGF